ncbi:M20 metallopeptidase family protein [Paenibacillus arenosi]|uniref:Amidohydrolase n=1 Tax=Paenibacillus arenosi TaxID=2774142 RepID=A0ABR9ARW8_9BACL|nr:amidohydrolase [Paenibacillus arenosi]MBD8496848.1 amidohydrolase [Paenibacillus arenosi]
MRYNWFNQQLLELNDQIVAWRRYLHQHPERSYHEEQTASYIAEQLDTMGIDYRSGVGGHGIVATIFANEQDSAPIVALRADMDALEIQDEKQCEYTSTVPGTMHACGHDGHMATLLAVASVLQRNRDKWRGQVRLLFQPAEEVSPGGAQQMIKDGALDGVSSIYGVHLWTPIPYGKFAICEGPMMAAVDDFFLTINGKGGHGGMPHTCIDAVVVGAALVQQLQTIVSRHLSPLEPAVVSVGTLQAGKTQNIIADRAIMNGTLRSFSPVVREQIIERLEHITRHVCEMYGASYDLHIRRGYPALNNDLIETERMRAVAVEQFGAAALEVAEKMMPAEDFAYYGQHIPASFMLVGAGNEQEAKYPHHHPMFDFDEQAMILAAELLGVTALEALEQKYLEVGVNA